MILTALVRKPRRKLLDVYVDGELVITVGTDLAVERDLRPGMEVSRGDLRRLEYEHARRSCLQAAVRLLSYRQRSERELRQRLRQKGFAKPPIDEAVARLRQMGYVNDTSFAHFYAETQQAARPRSQRLLTVELRQKGVEASVAEQATMEVNDEAAAFDAASRRLSGLRGLEYQRFRERLGSFLTRRGFSYEVARGVIARCWEEQRPADENGASA